MVEHFQRFLNKSVTIAAEDRGATDMFVPAGISAGYAWNSAPIDGTDILRNVPAIGRDLHFPLDINLNAAPKLIQNNVQAVLEYLKLTDANRPFSSSILKNLIEDLRIAHAERINNSRNLVFLKAGDIVMARTAIQSNLTKNKVAKLSYSVRDPYQMVRHTRFGSYYVRKLYKPDSPELKFMAYDLYPLPSPLNLCKSVDTTNSRYLSQHHSPLVNSLKNHSTLKCTMRNGLVNLLQLRYLLLCTSMIPWNCSTTHHFDLLLCRTSTRKRIHALRNLSVTRKMIFYPPPFSPYIV